MSGVIIVGADVVEASSLQKALERFGVAAMPVQTGRQAQALVDETRTQLVLAAMRLPDMTVAEFLGCLRRRAASPRIVLLTDHPHAEQIVAAVKLGADDVLEMPVSGDTVRRIVDAYLSRDSRDQGGRAVMALLLIRRHFRRHDLSARAVAGMLRISPAHLSRVMKAHTGHGVMSAIRHERMKEVRRMLCTTSLLVKEIAYSVGYADLRRCERDFAKTFGCSPSEYRTGMVRKEHQVGTAAINE